MRRTPLDATRPFRRSLSAALLPAALLCAWCWPATARGTRPVADEGQLVELVTRGCGTLEEDDARLRCFDRAGGGSAVFGRALRGLGVACPGNRDPGARLTCWDRIFAALPPPSEEVPPGPAPLPWAPAAQLPPGRPAPDRSAPGRPAPATALPGTGRWETAPAREGGGSAPGILLFADAVAGSPAVASLFVQCRDGAPTVTFSPAHLIPDGDYPVSVQVGDGPVVSDTWSVTPNGMLLAAPTPIPLIEEVALAERATLRVPLPGEGAITASFDVRGLREAVVPVRRACRW